MTRDYPRADLGRWLAETAIADALEQHEVTALQALELAYYQGLCTALALAATERLAEAHESAHAHLARMICWQASLRARAHTQGAQS
jgi:hypothetical protein